MKDQKFQELAQTTSAHVGVQDLAHTLRECPLSLTGPHSTGCF